MNYIGEDELTDMMGIGYVGEIRRGPDGELYQWVEGVDGLGNLTGWWSKIKKGVKKVAKAASRYATKPYCIPLQAIPGSVKGIAKKVCRVVGKLSPLAHVPVVGSYYKGAAKLCKIAKDCGIAGLEGGLMQAPDGSLYQVQGLGEGAISFGQADDEVLYGLGQEDLTEIMGIGSLGQVRRGPDGEIYQWMEGIDGLGRRVRHWRCQGCIKAKKLLARRKRRKGKPVGSSSLPAPIQAPSAGVNGLGTVYQAPDGSVYEMSGIGEDEDLYGIGEDEELYGFAEDEDLYGLGDDDELYGLADDEDLDGFGEDEDLYGLGEDEDFDGINGYIKVKNGVNGLEAFVPNTPVGTRKFVRPTQDPEIWKRLW